ncbi:hypothetical protein ACTXT7_012799 [Hymenolepis weldensis]
MTSTSNSSEVFKAFDDPFLSRVSLFRALSDLLARNFMDDLSSPFDHTSRRPGVTDSETASNYEINNFLRHSLFAFGSPFERVKKSLSQAVWLEVVWGHTDAINSSVFQYSSNCNEQNCIPLSDTIVSGGPCFVKMRPRALIIAAVFVDGIDISSGHWECDSISTNRCDNSLSEHQTGVGTDNVLRLWNRSHFKYEDGHFVSKNFIAFLITESSAEACFIPAAVTGIFWIDSTKVQYTSFSRESAANMRVYVEDDAVVTAFWGYAFLFHPYSSGICLTEQLKVLYIFLSAASSQNYLCEFLENGGFLCLQELCVLPTAKEIDKYWALRVLSCVANGGTGFKETICECYG